MSAVKTVLKCLYYLPSNAINRLQYAVKGVHTGKRHETKGILCVRMARGASLVFGDDVRINSKGSANPIGCGERTYFQLLRGAKVTVGSGTRMSNCAVTAATCVSIGERVRIGAGVKIFDTDFHSLDPLERTAVPERGAGATKPIVIEDEAFIGAGAYILKGVTVGKAAVIGAGSVVTKSVPAREIWGGNPAKRIGSIDE